MSGRGRGDEDLPDDTWWITVDTVTVGHTWEQPPKEAPVTTNPEPQPADTDQQGTEDEQGTSGAGQDQGKDKPKR